MSDETISTLFGIAMSCLGILMFFLGNILGNPRGYWKGYEDGVKAAYEKHQDMKAE